MLKYYFFSTLQADYGSRNGGINAFRFVSVQEQSDHDPGGTFHQHCHRCTIVISHRDQSPMAEPAWVSSLPNGSLYRQENGNDFFIKPLKAGRWEFLLNSEKRIRILTYVHQVQRLWFSLMDEHLVLPKNVQQKSALQDKPKSGTFQKRH